MVTDQQEEIEEEQQHKTQTTTTTPTPTTTTTSSNNIKKRPGGLAATASKKTRQNTSTETSTDKDTSAITTTTTLDQQHDQPDAGTTRTVQVSSDADEVTELKEMFESALDKLGQGDVEEGLPLLRAVIHESDRLLRMHSKKMEGVASASNAMDEMATGTSVISKVAEDVVKTATTTTTTASATKQVDDMETSKKADDKTSTTESAASGENASNIEEAVKPLSSEFHYTYASALFRLGLHVGEEEAEEGGEGGADAVREKIVDYLDAAIFRFERALEAWKEEEKEAKTRKEWKFSEALGRVIMEKANNLIRLGSVKTADTIAKVSFRYLESAFDVLRLTSNKEDDDALIECCSIASIVARHAELLDDLEAHDRANTLSQTWFRDIITMSPELVVALKGLGQTYLASANVHLELAESGKKPMDAVVVGDLIDDALKYLQQACDKADEQNNVDTGLLCSLGEALINKANLLDEADDETEATSFYKRAVECFKKVEQVDPTDLPDQFSSFIQEWEEDLKK